MITAAEQGRNLVLTVGDGDGAIVVTVPPVSSKVGSGLMAIWAGITFGASETPEVDAENMSKIAIGEANWPVVDEELRWAEAQQVINAAFFWNVQGGGVELVNEFLTGGHPKAQASLLQANGLWDEYSLLTTLLSGGEASETPSPDATNGTSTPSGTSDSSTSALDHLPPNRRSIRQNEPPNVSS